MFFDQFREGIFSQTITLSKHSWTVKKGNYTKFNDGFQGIGN
jgi:hypothetical protein